MDAFLVNLEALSSEPGVPTSLSSALHRSPAFARSKTAFQSALQTLEQEGWIVTGNVPGNSGGRNDFYYHLTLAGWRRSEQLRRNLPSGRVAFIAMPFDTPSASNDELRQLTEQGIRPGVASAGFDAKRIDDEPHSEGIDFRIMNEIRNCRFVVADTTDSNPNVLFEVGFALGLGKPVIWICKKGHIERLKFDFRQYRHIAWTPADWDAFASELEQAIRFNVTLGPVRM